ncbi:MAG: prealbumin-like fold domain-containing protein [Gaiellales bacterium]
MPRRITIALALLCAFLLLPGAASASGNEHGSTRTTICHATGAGTWVSITIDDDAIVRQGHDGHANDVIPPFSHDDDQRYAGKNWDADGQAIWRNDCARITTPSPTPTGDMPAPPMQITFAARVCDSYADVYANRARNNLMESLQNLGADTPYTAGSEVLPTIEATGRQATGCHPLSGWQFSLGTGYQSRADSGAWGALSKVTNPYSQTITTRPTVPLPNVMGGTTGMTIDGAVTVELTATQAQRAQSSSKLWVQSGVPGDPVLTQSFGNQFAFAALRCAVDNLYGDNVEWVRYPQGHTDVFCFAYLVDQTPQSGTITIVKQVEGASGTQVQQTASFSGNVSYDAGGRFQVDARTGTPGQASFQRDATTQAGAPWSVVELPQTGWRLDRVSCTSASGRSSAQTTTVNSATEAGSVAVTLAGGDDVTCTFVNAVLPSAASTLTLTKVTVGGTGSFPVSVTLGGSAVGQTQLQTTIAKVAGSPQAIALSGGGTYVVAEAQPLSSLGTWRLVGVDCAGITATLIDDSSFSLPVSAGQGATCTVTNAFTPNGAITLRKVTEGAKGTAGFVVSSLADASIEREQRAETTAPGVGGEVVAAGDPLVGLPLGSYVIQETGDAYVGTDEWMLKTVICDGQPVPSTMGRVQIDLTVANPRVDCVFTNVLTPSTTPFVPLVPAFIPADPLLPPTPEHSPSGPGSPTKPITRLGKSLPRMGPIADVAIRVRATPRVVDRGSVVGYSVVARNNGPYAARNVTIVLSVPTAARPMTLTSSRGACKKVHGMFTCTLGTLLRGDAVTFTASRQAARPGSYPVRAVISTSTQETTTRNNVATTVVIVRGAAEPVVG